MKVIAMSEWEIEESKIVLDASPFFVVRQEKCRLPNGYVIPDYNIITEPDIVIGLIFTEDQQIVLVEQYKHGIGQVCLELPGGLSDGGTPLTEIQREVLEETGYASDDWNMLASYINNPTRFDNYVHAFIAHDAKQVSEQHLDPAESIRIVIMPIPDVLQAVTEGRITGSHSIAALYHGLTQLKYWQTIQP